MVRGEPTYDLHRLQQLLGQGLVSSWIMGTAKQGAEQLGLGDEEIVDAVLELTPQHLYKSMESERCPGLWQDVYHHEYRGLRLYIKLQMGVDGRAVVVQFKAR
ncbi:MAG TPA: type II toxin-antitoxin system MqsR family toxin [Longimicrobium sp.]